MILFSNFFSTRLFDPALHTETWVPYTKEVSEKEQFELLDTSSTSKRAAVGFNGEFVHRRLKTNIERPKFYAGEMIMPA